MRGRQQPSPAKKELTPAQYDHLIRCAERDQLAIRFAIGGFLLFFLVGLMTRDTGLEVYKLSCMGAIAFGVAGWIGAEIMLLIGNPNKPVFLDAAADQAKLVQIRELRVDQLKPGMSLAAAVIGMGGEEILPAGVKLEADHIKALRQMGVEIVMVESELV